MMENKTQRKRGKNKNQNENSFYHHAPMDSNNNSNHLYPVSSDNNNYSSPPRSSRNRYNNNARSQMNYTQSHALPNDNNPNNMHINAPNQNNSHHSNQNNHNHRPYNRDNSPYHSSHRYYRSNRNEAHARYQSNATHNQSKYQYNAPKARNAQYSHYQNHHVYPNHRNNNNPHSSSNHQHSHSHAAHSNNTNNSNPAAPHSNHTQQRARYHTANNSPRKHQDEYAQHNINHNHQHMQHIQHNQHNQHMAHSKHGPHHSHTQPQHHHPHGPRSATPHNQHLNHTHNAHSAHSHNNHAHGQHLHIMPAKHLSHRLASQSTSALMCNISAPHSPASVLSSPSATYYDVDDRIKDNDGSHKYHRFDDQNYPLTITQMTKICQILGQKHEIHDKLKSRQHNRDFSTILSRFLLRLLERLETCPVDGFCVDAILLGGGAAAYVLDEHSKPKETKNKEKGNGSANNVNDNDPQEDNGPNNEYKFPPLHYNDVDIMLEIDFEEWDDLVTKWKAHNRSVDDQKIDKRDTNMAPTHGDDEQGNKEQEGDQVKEQELPFRNRKEHHIAVYAAIRMAFLQCLREFAPKDMQNMDVEDICSAYIDTQKRFLCGDEDNNGGNSDCWAIYSGNHDRGHYLDLVFIHKMKRRYTFSTDSFRIKITKSALQFISESIKQHDRQYKQQQFIKKQRNRSSSYPSLNVLKIKRADLDEKRKEKRARDRHIEQQKQRETELTDKDTDECQQNRTENKEEERNETEDNDEATQTTKNIEPNPLILPRFGVAAYPFSFLRPLPGQLPYGAPLHPPVVNIPGGPPPPYPFTGYHLPNKPEVTLRAVINWSDLADKLAEKQIEFYAYALCGDYKKARDNLQKRNIGKVANPEKIHGGGFFKYCDLISKQWKRSEKLEKFLWIRLSWDIDINRDYDRKQTSDEYNDDPNGNDRYNYMNDLKDIDRTLATYIRRHYKNRAQHVTKFLNSLEIVIKDLRQDDAALEVLCDNIHRLRGKLERHLHEEHIHDMNTKHNQNTQMMNSIRSKSPPIDMVSHTHHSHMNHNGRNVTTHAVHTQHAQHPPPPGPPLTQHILHPSALKGPPSHPPNGTNPVFPPLPNGAPVMPPGGVLINHHFNLVHHGKQIHQSMRNMLMPQPPPPPNVNTAPPHRPPPIFYPAPNPPVPYLRANRAQGQNTSNPPAPPPPNNNTNTNPNTNNAGSGSIALRPLHQNTLQEYQQRYNNNEWVSLYTGHSAPGNAANASNTTHAHPRKAYHIVPNGQVSKVLPSLVNLNLTKAPPEQTTNIGNIISSYIPFVPDANNNDEEDDEREDDINDDDIANVNDNQGEDDDKEEDDDDDDVEEDEEEEIVNEEDNVEPDVVCDDDLSISNILINDGKEQMMIETFGMLEDEDDLENHVNDVEDADRSPNKEIVNEEEEETALCANRMQMQQKEEETLPTTPSSIDSDNDPLNMDDIAVDKMMNVNLELTTDEKEEDDVDDDEDEDDENIIKILENIDIESDKENNINVNNDNNECNGSNYNDKPEDNDANAMEDITEEGHTNIVSVLPVVNNCANININSNASNASSASPTNAEPEGVKQTNFNANAAPIPAASAQAALPNTISQHQIKLVPSAPTIPGYPRFFQVNGQTYQFPVANYFVIVPQHNTPLRTHNQRQPVYIPPNMLYTVNNHKDEDNKLEVGATKHKHNDSASPPPPSGATQSSFNKGVFIESNINTSPQNTQTSPSLLPMRTQLQHFHSPNMIHPRAAPPPPSHILHRPAYLPHQPPQFLIQSHLLTQQQQQQAAASQQQQNVILAASQQQQNVILAASQHESATKETFPPPQKNNSERFRRPENMNDNNNNNELANNPVAATNNNNNSNCTPNNNKAYHRVRAYAHHPPPPNQSHTYFYNNNQNNNNQQKTTEAHHSNLTQHNRGAYRQRNNNNNGNNNNNNNNNSNNNNNNNNNYRNNNIHYSSYNKRGYNR